MVQADYHREEIQRILAGGFAMNLKPEELVKALRCCAEGECSGCPMYADKQRCQEQTLASSADQIERDQKEIAELKAKVEQYRAFIPMPYCLYF